MYFISSKVLVSDYRCGRAEPSPFEMITSKVLNSNLYTIELGYRDFTWKIKRFFKHFQALYQELLMFKALLKLPLPTHM